MIYEYTHAEVTAALETANKMLKQVSTHQKNNFLGVHAETVRESAAANREQISEEDIFQSAWGSMSDNSYDSLGSGGDPDVIDLIEDLNAAGLIQENEQ